MGHQESYLKMKNSKDFNKLVETIKKYDKDKFFQAMPVEIITLLKPIEGDLSYQCHPEIQYSYSPGEKFIYVVGDRHGQSSARNFFMDCNNVPKNILNNLEIIFCECFPSEDIFENNEITQMAKHEQFWSNEE